MCAVAVVTGRCVVVGDVVVTWRHQRPETRLGPSRRPWVVVCGDVVRVEVGRPCCGLVVGGGSHLSSKLIMKKIKKDYEKKNIPGLETSRVSSPPATTLPSPSLVRPCRTSLSPFPLLPPC